jgi:hypothetical protein
VARLAFFISVALLVLAACSSDDSSTFTAGKPDGGGEEGSDGSGGGVCTSDAGPPSATDFMGQPDCPAKTCTLSGTLAGQPIMKSYPRGKTYNFYNGGGGAFDVDFGTGGHVHIEFMGPLGTGQVGASTTATVLMPTEGPMPGQTICATDGSRVEQVSATEARFLLRCIGTQCFGTATPIGGEVFGCCAP